MVDSFQEDDLRYLYIYIKYQERNNSRTYLQNIDQVSKKNNALFTMTESTLMRDKGEKVEGRRYGRRKGRNKKVQKEAANEEENGRRKGRNKKGQIETANEEENGRRKGRNKKGQKEAAIMKMRMVEGRVEIRKGRRKRQ